MSKSKVEEERTGFQIAMDVRPHRYRKRGSGKVWRAQYSGFSSGFPHISEMIWSSRLVRPSRMSKSWLISTRLLE